MAPGFAPHRNAIIANNVLLLLILVVLRRRRRRRIRTYQHEVNKNRVQQGDFYNLLQELRNSGDGGERFRQVMRMTIDQFDWLLARVEPHLQHKNTHACPISPAERLAMTIRYLASGNEQASVALAFRVGAATVNMVVEETCNVIWEVLQAHFVKFPSSVEDWLEIAHGFEDKWQFPHCLGALDGKHVTMQAPPNAGSNYFNYKKTHSIVLMALCDANYCFTFVDIGCPGRNSDGGVFSNTSFGSKLVDNPSELNLPPASSLPGWKEEVGFPYVVIADEAFPLKQNLMRPFPGVNIPEEKLIYNYRLSRARRIIENAFGILVARWRIFKGSTIARPERLISYVKAAIVLHNFLLKAEEDMPPEERVYCPAQFMDRNEEENGQWRRIVQHEGGSLIESVARVGSNNFSNAAGKIREHFMEYFNSDVGEVAWQLAKVRRGRVQRPNEQNNS
ncbi:uncharacterized protein [Amphiura filiformis]|uniref:uncharacterized protein n=1 Tax=Amphiura filiformis TaxID=82378 RepID=UPI003B20FC17